VQDLLAFMFNGEEMRRQQLFVHLGLVGFGLKRSTKIPIMVMNW
jgi:hypothetical protein